MCHQGMAESEVEAQADFDKQLDSYYTPSSSPSTRPSTAGNAIFLVGDAFLDSDISTDTNSLDVPASTPSPTAPIPHIHIINFDRGTQYRQHRRRDTVTPNPSRSSTSYPLANPSPPPFHQRFGIIAEVVEISACGANALDNAFGPTPYPRQQREAPAIIDTWPILVAGSLVNAGNRPSARRRSWSTKQVHQTLFFSAPTGVPSTPTTSTTPYSVGKLLEGGGNA